MDIWSRLFCNGKSADRLRAGMLTGQRDQRLKKGAIHLRLIAPSSRRSAMPPRMPERAVPGSRVGGTNLYSGHRFEAQIPINRS
jgi:hypothetical protein